ncbi:MAG: hypothetical protein HYS75_05200 [Nitrosopumilales archaeon]|nr:hypothetical protein [Nitrosopumilales archaeon]
MITLVHITTRPHKTMFKEIIRRLQCKKENTSSDVNAFKESDSKKPEKE